MKYITRVDMLLLVIALLLSACGPKLDTSERVAPSRLEPIEGTDLSRVILTEKAAERLGIETVSASGNEVPYAAVIYDTQGNTWIYTSPEALTYVRARVEINYIEGDRAVLSRSLDSVLTVVTVGVAELYGTETGVSK